MRWPSEVKWSQVDNKMAHANVWFHLDDRPTDRRNQDNSTIHLAHKIWKSQRKTIRKRRRRIMVSAIVANKRTSHQELNSTVDSLSSASQATSTTTTTTTNNNNNNSQSPVVNNYHHNQDCHMNPEYNIYYNSTTSSAAAVNLNDVSQSLILILRPRRSTCSLFTWLDFGMNEWMKQHRQDKSDERSSDSNYLLKWPQFVLINLQSRVIWTLHLLLLFTWLEKR